MNAPTITAATAPNPPTMITPTNHSARADPVRIFGLIPDTKSKLPVNMFPEIGKRFIGTLPLFLENPNLFIIIFINSVYPFSE